MRHKHQCADCKTVWEHEQRDDVSNAAYHKLHDCPQCGQNQREVHFESEAEEKAWKEWQRRRDPFKAAIFDFLDALAALK